MTTAKRPHHRRDRARQCTLPMARLPALAGCAPIPAIDRPVAPKSAEQPTGGRSFAETAAAWPGNGRCQVYGDAQVDALIQEAWRNSPDLALAQVVGAPLKAEVTANIALVPKPAPTVDATSIGYQERP